MEKVTIYKTTQREVLLNYLKANKDKHLTIENMVKNLKENNYSIGQTTIYRYINMLVSSGIVRKYITDITQPACFQYVGEGSKCEEHYHLKCDKCGKIFHIRGNNFNDMSKYLEKEYDFKVDNSKVILYGNCKICSKGEQ